MTRWLLLFAFAGSLQAAIAPLGYEEALQAILDRNPDIATARANLDQVKARNLPDHLSLLPTVQLVGTQTYNKSTSLSFDPFGEPYIVSPEQSSLVGGLNARLNLFRFGADVQAMRAANTEETSADWALKSQYLTTEYDGAVSLNGLIQATKDLDIYQRILDMREGIVRVSRERFQRGLMAEQEVNKLAVDLENDRAALRDTQITQAEARAHLIALLGHDSIQLEWPWLEKLRTGRPSVLTVDDKALSTRPDWQAAETRVRAARQRKWQNFGQFLPSLDVSASYNQQTFRPGGNVSFSGPESQVQLILTVPLFDRLAGYSQYATQVQTESIAEWEFEKLKRNALAEWQSAKSALEISLQTARDREQTLGMARKLYEDNLLRFRKGLVSANDLSVDQNRLLQSEQLAVRGWNNVHTNFSRLCKAIGRRTKECWQ